MQLLEYLDDSRIGQQRKHAYTTSFPQFFDNIYRCSILVSKTGLDGGSGFLAQAQTAVSGETREL